MQHRGGVLELLVFEQPAYELARGSSAFSPIASDPAVRLPRLNKSIAQRSRGIPTRHQCSIPASDGCLGKILLGDPGYGNVVDVELLTANHVQKQVERPSNKGRLIFRSSGINGSVWVSRPKRQLWSTCLSIIPLPLGEG